MHIDPEIIASLRALGGPGNPGFLNELIDAYLGDSGIKMSDIEKAFASGNANALHRAAHALKGSSGSMGAVALSGECASLEAAALAGGPEAVSVKLRSVRAQFDEVEKELRALRSPGKG